jgi:hypothetical protein
MKNPAEAGPSRRDRAKVAEGDARTLRRPARTVESFLLRRKNIFFLFGSHRLFHISDLCRGAGSLATKPRSTSASAQRCSTALLATVGCPNRVR